MPVLGLPAVGALGDAVSVTIEQRVSRQAIGVPAGRRGRPRSDSADRELNDREPPTDRRPEEVTAALLPHVQATAGNLAATQVVMQRQLEPEAPAAAGPAAPATGGPAAAEPATAGPAPAPTAAPGASTQAPASGAGGSGEEGQRAFAEGSSAFESGYAGDAASMFERAHGQADPERQPTLLADIAFARLRAGDPDRALEIARQLTESGHPELAARVNEAAARRLFALGQAAFDSGSFADAVRWFEQAAELAPPERQPTLRYNLAAALAHIGQTERASAIGADLAVTGHPELAAKIEEIQSRLARGTEGGPGGGPGAAPEASAAPSTGAPAEPAGARAPAAGGPDTEAQASYEQGAAVLEAGYSGDAARLLERAHGQADPASQPTLLADVAIAHLREGDADRALAIARQLNENGHPELATHIHEFAARRLFALGKAAIESGSYSDAIRWLEQAIELAPEERRAVLRYNLAVAFAHAGQTERADALSDDLSVTGHEDLAAKIFEIETQIARGAEAGAGGPAAATAEGSGGAG